MPVSPAYELTTLPLPSKTSAKRIASEEPVLGELNWACAVTEVIMIPAAKNPLNKWRMCPSPDLRINYLQNLHVMRVTQSLRIDNTGGTAR